MAQGPSFGTRYDRRFKSCLAHMVHVKLSKEEAESLIEGGTIEIVSANLGAPGHNGSVTLEVDDEDNTNGGATEVRTGNRRF